MSPSPRSFCRGSILNPRPHGDLSYDGARLVCRPLKDPLPPLSIVLARVKNARLTRRAEAFAEHCREYFLRARGKLGAAAARPSTKTN